MTRHWSRHALFGACVAVLLMGDAAAAHAQSGTTGVVVGEVRDAQGLPLPGVFVTLRQAETGLLRLTFTDRDGGYRFPFLAPGDYAVTVEKVGYTPQTVAGMPLRSGQEVYVPTELLQTAAGGAVVVADFGRAALAAGSAGAGQWVAPWLARAVPSERRSVGELARLTSTMDETGIVQGLPAWLSLQAIDGTTFRPAAHPLQWQALGGTAFALGGVGSAQVLTTPADVEWSGAAGGILSAHSRRGTPALELEARGGWTGSALPGPSFGDSGLSYNDVQGAFAARLPLLADSARLSLGVDLRRMQTPVSRAWGDSPTARALADLGDSFGLDLRAYGRAGLAPADALSAFARFDWNVAIRHRLGSWLHLASQPRLAAADPRTGVLQEIEGTDLLGGVNLISTFGESVDNEARVSVTTSSRSTAEVAAVAPTWIVSDGLTLGGARTFATGEETRVALSDAVHLRSGRHALKLGASFTANTHSYDYRPGADGEYYFGGLNEVLGGRGLFVRTEGPAQVADWTSGSAALFVQDRWNAGDGLELLLGVRVEHETLPADRVVRDTEWQRLSGLANDSVAGTRWRPDGRFGLTWDIQRSHRWIVHAAGGLFSDRVDPLLLSQWITDAGRLRVQRELGVVDWPSPSSTTGTTFRLTMLGPGFDVPRTARLSGGLTYMLTPATAVQIAGVGRRTENLPRRADLNLLPLPAARDQYGRAVYGTLVKQGALVAAEPGTGRRFEAYDEVAGITADGWSRHWGVTLGVEHEPLGGVGFIGRYTFSSTRDNWFGAREGGWTVAAPQGLAGGTDWADGTSDFDVPHRAVAALVLNGPLGSRLSAAYRFQSGLPFTPGFRAGVDASGDGAPSNDPAFVDANFSGMPELMSRMPCLRESAGRFAARNSCRGEAQHALDLSFALQVLRIDGGGASLLVDVFDLLEGAGNMPDAALFLIDPDTDLVTNPGARTVSVPLLLNPNFGETLVRPHTGRKIRLGLSLTW